jgi:hypothetical protein
MLWERRGLLIADREYPSLDFEPGSSLDQLQAATVCEAHQHNKLERLCSYQRTS